MTLARHFFERNKKPETKPKKTRTLSITSGKGGVGKTVSIVNIAIAASNRGLKVLLVDGDFGLANVDIVLGLTSQYTLDDVIDGFVSIEEIILDGPDGLSILPSASGIGQFESLNLTRRQCLISSFRKLENVFDLILIDTGAGIGENVLHLNSIVDARLIVTTCDPHALTDAYTLMKIMCEQKDIRDFDLMINMAHTDRDAMNTANRLISTAKNFTDLNINYKGCVPKDQYFCELIRKQKMGSQEAFSTIAGQALNRISEHYVNEPKTSSLHGEKNFWGQYLTPECQIKSVSTDKRNQF